MDDSHFGYKQKKALMNLIFELWHHGPEYVCMSPLPLIGIG
jgi:hypothetical protein